MTGPVGAPRCSVIVPIYNEAENIHNVLTEIEDVLAPHGSFEVIAIDDGSTDQSLVRIREWKQRRSAAWLRVLRLAKNCGQSAAVMAGVESARSPIVATLDGDMQNDPRDLLAMLEHVESGQVDGVFGVRRRRRDKFLRRLSSKVGNRVRNWITGDVVTDAACGIKVVRRDFFLRPPRFTGMHRFMATLVRDAGGRIAEVDVNHRPRIAGTAKYGIGNRMWRGLRDCFAVRWMRSRVLVHSVQEEF